MRYKNTVPWTDTSTPSHDIQKHKNSVLGTAETYKSAALLKSFHNNHNDTSPRMQTNTKTNVLGTAETYKSAALLKSIHNIHQQLRHAAAASLSIQQHRATSFIGRPSKHHKTHYFLTPEIPPYTLRKPYQTHNPQYPKQRLKNRKLPVTRLKTEKL